MVLYEKAKMNRNVHVLRYEAYEETTFFRYNNYSRAEEDINFKIIFF